MNTLVFVVLPLIGALLGWLAVRLALQLLFRPIEPKRFLGMDIQGLLPRRQKGLAAEIGKKAASLLHVSGLGDKAKDPALIAGLMPGIEAHIDGFLQQRLKEKIPVLAMFLSDGVLLTIRTSLLEEIEALLPEVVAQFAGRLGSSLDVEKIVTDRFAAIPPEQLEAAVRSSMRQEMRLLSLGGAGLGLLIGLIQVALTAWLQTR